MSTALAILSIALVGASALASALAWMMGRRLTRPAAVLDAQAEAIRHLNASGTHEFESTWHVLSCGIKVHLLHRICKAGKEATLLIIPGTGSFSLSYVPFMNHLTHKHVYVLDLPGWGISDCPLASDGAPLNLAKAPLPDLYRFYADVIAEVASLTAPTHLLAHSLGALFTVHFMRHHPHAAAPLNINLMSLPGLSAKLEHAWLWAWLIKHSVPEMLLKQWWAPYVWYCARWWISGAGPVKRFHAIALMNPKGRGYQILARHITTQNEWSPLCIDTLREHATPKTRLMFGANDTIVSPGPDVHGVERVTMARSWHNPSSDEGARIAAYLS